MQTPIIPVPSPDFIVKVLEAEVFVYVALSWGDDLVWVETTFSKN